MLSARLFTRHFFGHRRVKAPTQLPLPCLPDLTKAEGNAVQRHSKPPTGRNRQFYSPCPISANSIASQLVRNGTYKTNDSEFTKLVLKEMSALWRIPTPADKCISGDLSPDKFAKSLQMLKPRKAPGPDSICPKLIIHAGAALKSWPKNFLSSCMHQLKLPRIWRRALGVTIPKSMKPPGKAKSYRPISLLCVPFEIMERLIYASRLY